jgi:acyl carrier protein
MGLGIVELIMDIEDEFGISVDDRDVSEFETIGQVFDLVMHSLKRQPATAPCASARCFYNVRRALSADGDVRRTRVRPDSTFEELVAQDRRWAVVKRLTRRLGLPDLPTRFVARTGTREPQWLRVRDVVASYVQRSPGRFVRGRRVDEQAAWEALRGIVVRHTGEDPIRITRQSHFLRDLRLD